MKRTIITVVGKDTVGIIARVCTYLANNKINIEDISQTIMNEYFVMIMLVDISEIKEELSALARECAEMGKGIGMSIQMQHEDIFNAMYNV